MSNMNKFNNGVWPVVVTPFNADLTVDYDGYKKMLEWYLANKVDGLFAVCLSSELYTLTGEERLKLGKIAVEMANGKVPVVCCAGLEDTIEEKIKSIIEMANQGCDAVVIPVCQLAKVSESDEVLCNNFQKILDKTGDIKLGLYECPAPYHRLVSPETLAKLAKIGGERFPFLKDTCCDSKIIKEKLDAVKGYTVKLYNANLTTLLQSLKDGAAGYSGTSANFYPALLSYICHNFDKDPTKAEELQEFFDLIQRHIEFKYPSSAKKFISYDVAGLLDICRVPCDRLSSEQTIQQKVLHKYIDKYKKSLYL